MYLWGHMLRVKEVVPAPTPQLLALTFRQGWLGGTGQVLTDLKIALGFQQLQKRQPVVSSGAASYRKIFTISKSQYTQVIESKVLILGDQEDHVGKENKKWV